MAETALHELEDWSPDRSARCHSHNIDPEGLTVHYTGPSNWARQAGIDRSSPERFEATADHRRCAPLVRAHRDFHMDDPSRRWCFLAYNEVACPHGHRYESRPPGHRSGAQGTNEGNYRSYAALYLAGAHDPLTDSAKRAFHDVAARFGVPLRWGHREWNSTACPETPPPPALWAWRLAGFPLPASAADERPEPEDDDMARAHVYRVTDPQTGKRHLWLCDGMSRRLIHPDDVNEAAFLGWAASADVVETDELPHVATAVRRCPELVSPAGYVMRVMAAQLAHEESEAESPAGG